MYEKLLSEAEKYVESHKTKEVPILELWDEMAERAEEMKFDMPENLGDFEMLIEADKKFIFVAAKIEDEIEDLDVGEEEGEYEVGEDFFEVEKMEKLGFNQDQIVGLKKFEKKKISEEDDDDAKLSVHAGSLHKNSSKKSPNPVTEKKKQTAANAKTVKPKTKNGKHAKGKK